MPQTTADLALELSVSERQVINYKTAVEAHLQRAITFRQGKQHFYHDRYLPLLRLYAEGKPLPPVEEQLNPFPPLEEPVLEGAIVLTEKCLPAPTPLAAIPVEVLSVDTSAVDAQTDRNLVLTDQFKSAIKSQVMAEARAFGQELKAQVKHTVIQEVAKAYREVIR